MSNSITSILRLIYYISFLIIPAINFEKRQNVNFNLTKWLIDMRMRKIHRLFLGIVFESIYYIDRDWVKKLE